MRWSGTKKSDQVRLAGLLISLNLPSWSLNYPKGGSFALFTGHASGKFDFVMRNPTGGNYVPSTQQYFDAGHSHDDTVGSVALEIEGDLDSKVGSTIGSLCCCKPKVPISSE